MRFKARIFSLLLVLCLSAAAAHACPTGVFLMDLKTGSFINQIGGQVSFPPLVNSPVAGCAGWKETVLTINFAGGGATCTRANLVTEWEGLPKAWTLNIGDSPTNDGFGGGVVGTTLNDAELWVLNERMSVANGGSTVDTLYNQDLSLTDSALKFVVKNQYISFGQPFGFLQTPNLKQLFALPDTNANGDGSRIYVGLNRVIYNAQNNGRRGCGLRRVLVTLQ